MPDEDAAGAGTPGPTPRDTSATFEDPGESPEAAVPPVDVDPGYTASGVPTFESVREKIETRYGTALGATELAVETPEGRAVEEQYDQRQRTAAKRLEEIRESMREENS